MPVSGISSVWLEHCIWVAGVVGSNPAFPTNLRKHMVVREYSPGLYVIDLVMNKHFKIKTNKHGRTKFCLRGCFKKRLKKLGISYYFLWGNEFPTQIVLRNVEDEKLLTYLALYE